MSKREGGLGLYLGVLLIGQLLKMIVYLLVPLAVFCRSGRTVSMLGSCWLVRNFVESHGEIKQNYIYLVPRAKVLSDVMRSD